MSAARSDETQIELLLSGAPEKRERYILESLADLKTQTAAIVQHCRYCTDDADAGKAEPAAEADRHTWVMWSVGRWLLDRVLAVAIAAVITCIITLALTGQLGG